MNNNTHFVKEVLKYTFGIVPMVAGFDKFTNILTSWDQYLSAGFVDMLPFETSSFMIIVGIIEIVAGIPTGTTQYRHTSEHGTSNYTLEKLFHLNSLRAWATVLREQTSLIISRHQHFSQNK